MTKKKHETGEAFIQCVAKQLVGEGFKYIKSHEAYDGRPCLIVAFDNDSLEDESMNRNCVEVIPDPDDPEIIYAKAELLLKFDIKDPESIDQVVKFASMTEALFQMKK